MGWPHDRNGQAGAAVSRRAVLKGAGTAMGALGGGAIASAVLAPALAGTARAAANVAAPAQRRWFDLNIIGDEFMDGQLLRSFEALWHGMGDIGECLDTASRIVPGDVKSYFAQWYATAERVAGIAKKSADAGHPISAGEAYMRACNYYRTAEFIEHDNAAARKSAECFQQAMKLLAMPVEYVRIPYENTTLPGYFFRATGATKKAPLVIVHSGFDGTPEEMKFVGEGAVKRGMHCLLFSGPGQGLVIREQKIPFRHDWEKVVTPVVDFALAQPGVDAQRIVLRGDSMGGFLAPRAAAFEHRLKICVANPGVLNFYALSTHYHGQEAMALLKKDPAAFETLMQERMRKSTRMRMAINDSILKFGASSQVDLYTKLERYDNEKIVGQIRCQTLVMDGEEEGVNANQAKLLYDALSCPKHYLYFDKQSTGSLHCQTGAIALSNQRVFDWLEQQLART
jgi:esterase/lipase